MPSPVGEWTPKELERLTYLKDVLAPRVHSMAPRGKLAELPLNSEDWAMVYAAYEGFTLIVQHIAKRAIERELHRKAQEEAEATIVQLTGEGAE